MKSRQSIRFATLAILIVLITLAVSHTANSRLKLSSSRFTTAANGEPVTHVTIAVTPSDSEDASTLNQTDIELLYNGTLRPKPGKVLLTNAQANIAGVNFVPATKLMSAYLILQRNDGIIEVIPNLNSQVSRLCRSNDKPFFDGYCEITSIKGRYVSLYSEAYGEASYDIVIKVSNNASFKLVKYEKNLWKPG